MPHGVQPLGLGVGEAQPHRQPLGVFRRCHRQRAEAADSVGGEAEHPLRLDHVRERAMITDARGDAAKQATIFHFDQRVGGALRHHELEHFHPQPLRRQRSEPVARSDAGLHRGAVRLALPVSRVDAEEAQDAQEILADAARGVADEPHAARFDVGETADMIMHDAIGGQRQAVDGEIAPLGIPHPVAAERDLGLAAEGLDILAQRRDFNRRAFDHQRDGAML
ncbi:hypothetical protein BN961_02368 [Afipia felis]|uniref:Uncharacterized protein n=1 Tax=Afipia felis TaxID=1035 RepID=A0A090N7P2_AFIFE|nr:hypothetical protein BN961_02368 [Afipia felis]